MNFYYILSTTFVYSETIENNEKEASFRIFLLEIKKSGRVSTVRKRKKILVLRVRIWRKMKTQAKRVQK